jgi:hypothetical protein
MKKAIVLGLLLVAIAAEAAMYKVYVRRVEQDLYKTNDGLFFQTQYCYEYVYGDEAIYDEDGGGPRGRLIFPNSNNSCDVRTVFR